MARNMRPAPPGYEVVKLPDAGRWCVLQVIREPRTGVIEQLKPMQRGDGRGVFLFASRARAVIEITLYAQAEEIARLQSAG